MIKKDSKQFGIIPNNMITDIDIPDNAIAIYAVLRTVYFDINRSCAKFCINSLLELLSVNVTQGKLIKPINEGLLYLMDNEYIELHDIFNNRIEFDVKYKSEYKVSFLLEDENSCITCEGGMTMIPEENMFSLLQYISANKGIKKYQLIRFYLLIARGCSNNNQMWKLSQKYFNEILGLAKETCSNWNNVLQDVGIIFYNNDYCYVKDGKFKSDATIYFHRNNGEVDENRNLFEKAVSEMAKDSGLQLIDKEEVRSKRSRSMEEVWAKRKMNSNNIVIDNNEDSSSIWGNSLDDCFEEEFAI